VFRQEYGAEFLDFGAMRPFRPTGFVTGATTTRPSPTCADRSRTSCASTPRSTLPSRRRIRRRDQPSSAAVNACGGSTEEFSSPVRFDARDDSLPGFVVGVAAVTASAELSPTARDSSAPTGSTPARSCSSTSTPQAAGLSAPATECRPGVPARRPEGWSSTAAGSTTGTDAGSTTSTDKDPTRTTAPHR
jgi:hypothetical protein